MAESKVSQDPMDVAEERRARNNVQGKKPREEDKKVRKGSQRKKLFIYSSIRRRGKYQVRPVRGFWKLNFNVVSRWHGAPRDGQAAS